MEELISQFNFTARFLPGGNGHLPGNLKINQLAYVGAHNAPCTKDLGWVYAQQRVSLRSQIVDFGARYFKINLHWFYPVNGYCGCCNSKDKTQNQPYIAIAHEPDGKSNCRFSIICRGFSFPQRARIIFKALADIFKLYSKEIFIIKIESYLYSGLAEQNGTLNYTNEDINKELDTLLQESGMKEIIYQQAFSISNVPCLNDLRKGQNLLLFIDNKKLFLNNPKANLYFRYSNDYICQTDWADDPLSDHFSAELGRVQKDKNGDNLNVFFEAHFNPEASFSFLSYGKKYNSSEHVTNRYEKLCEFYKKQVNFLTSDYIEEGKLAEVVDKINHMSLIKVFEKIIPVEANQQFIPLTSPEECQEKIKFPMPVLEVPISNQLIVHDVNEVQDESDNLFTQKIPNIQINISRKNNIE